jgi:hypothetical protein
LEKIIFAQGGLAKSSLMYDPRLMVEPARSQARRQSPFGVLFSMRRLSIFGTTRQANQILAGLIERRHRLKANREMRYKPFRKIFQVVCTNQPKIFCIENTAILLLLLQRHCHGSSFVSAVG